MAQRFRWTRRGYVAELEKAEVRLLRGLVKDVVTLLENRQDEVLPETPGAVAEASGADAAARPSAADGDDAAFWALVGLSLIHI